MALYNLRNPAVKRLMREAEELNSPTDEYHARPLEDNLFEWHFTIKGPPNSDFEGGIYHGRITLPPEYPMKPPSIILLTPNGRFEVNKKICLSISGHHPESWQPSWSIRTALLAIIGFMPTHGNGALGSLEYTPEERKQLALKSQDWKCSECGYVKDIFKSKDTSSSNESPLSPVNEVDFKQDDVSPSLSTDESSVSGGSVPMDFNSLPSIYNDSSLHQRKAAVGTLETESTLVDAENTVNTDNPPSKSCDFYTVLMWVIIVAIALLSLRRLFSL